MARRPEHERPADLYYDDDNAHKYHFNGRIQAIQRRMTERAIELLQLPTDGTPCHILDLGCGTGLSGEVLAERGHTWVGMDISRSMLKICRRRDEEDDDEEDDEEDDAAEEGGEGDGEQDNNDEGEQDAEEEGQEEELPVPVRERQKWAEVMQGDMGSGVPFRPGVFDGVVSISAVQWLCNIDKKGHIPQKRLRTLFQTLYNSMRRGARAVIQFYPESAAQVNMISQAAMKCGFGGGMVVDFPHSTRAKKYFLVIYAGSTGSGGYVPPRPLDESDLVAGAGGDDDDDEVLDSDDYEDYEEGEEDEEDDNDDDDWEDMDPVAQRKAIGKQQEEEMKKGGSNKKNAASASQKNGITSVRVDGRNRRNKHAAAAAARRQRRGDNRPVTGTKAWVLLKKEQRRKFGLQSRPDTKYTMRRRKPKF